VPITDLATRVYDILRNRVLTVRRPTMTYRELTKALGSKTLPRSPTLVDALAEVAVACRAVSLPVITVVVVHGADGLPGPGYFDLAHPHGLARGERSQFNLDLVAATQAKHEYPATLG
jgi:hypothetical protein